MSCAGLNVALTGFRLEMLLASWVLKQHPAIYPTLIGDRLKVPHREDMQVVSGESFSNLLRRLGVAHTVFRPHVGVRSASGNTVDELSIWLRSKDIGRRVLGDWAAKANAHSVDRSRRMGAQRMIRCDYSELADVLIQSTEIVRTPVRNIRPNAVNNDATWFDYVLIGSPEARCQNWGQGRVPPPKQNLRTVCKVLPRHDGEFKLWDLILTPHTPEGCLHTSMTLEDCVRVEMKGSVEDAQLISELNWMFPNGYDLLSIEAEEEPARLDLNQSNLHPSNILYTQDIGGPVASFENAIDVAYNLIRNWSSEL